MSELHRLPVAQSRPIRYIAIQFIPVTGPHPILHTPDESDAPLIVKI